MRLGIDFGTTRTVVAAAIDGRYPVLSFETEHGFAEYVPGTAAMMPEPRYGWKAVDSDAESGFLRSIKRIVTGAAPDDAVSEFGEDATTALELLTGYLSALRDAIVSASNLDVAADEPLEAMIAVPAHASTHQRYLTIEAFRRAGFAVLGLVGEPTAAAIEYAHRHLSALKGRSPKRYVVVYDLGGGTFDTSAVSLENREFRLLATEGIARLGGDDFDELILELALENAKPNRAIDSLSPEVRVRALEACREAKERLSPTAKLLHVELEDFGSVAIEVAKLVERTQPLVDRTLEKLERVFEALPRFGIDPENSRELGALYLVGGGTSFPPIQKLLKARFKQKVQLAVQPHAAAAIGLAILADRDRSFEVKEGVTRHFGVWREAEAGKKKVFDRIFSKDATPVEVSRRYRPVHAVGLLRFVECTELTADGEPAGDLMPCGELLFPYDPELAARGDWTEADAARPLGRHAEIVESYAYDAHGIVHVAVENATEGYRREARLNG